MTTTAAVAWRFLAIAIGAVGAGLAAGGAQAQMVISSPREIAACLCLEQTTIDLQAEVDLQRQVYEASRREFESLSDQAEARKAQMNVNDYAEIVAYRELLAKRDAAEIALKVELMPTYAAVVARYNQAVQSYNASCGGRSYAPEALAEVRKNLYCPK